MHASDYELPTRRSISMRWQRVRGVFNHFEAAPSRERQNRVDVAWPAAKMNRGDRLTARRPFSLGVIKVDRQRDGITIDENDVRTEVVKSGGCRRERQSRH